MSASLIGRLGSSAFRLSTAAVSMSPAGSRFSSESAPGPFHHGIRGRGGTIYSAALPSNERQVQADMRTHLIHRPARGHHSTARWSSSFLLSGLILRGPHAAASLIGRLGRSADHTSELQSPDHLACPLLPSESTPRPFHHGIRG